MLAPLRTARYHRSMTATARLSPSQPLALPGRKTASGGLQPWTRHRVGRTRLQPTDASGKNRPRYDLARRGAVLPQSKPCPPPSQSVAGQVADWASWIGDRADETAVVSGGLGLVTAPTGAGFAIFEGTALIAGGVGRVASIVNIGANLVDGNLEGAAQGAVSFIGGSAGGFATKGLLGRSMASGRMFGNLNARQQRVNNVAGDAVAGGYGRIVGKIGC